jgi:tetratricopeptide (TPR) repeat protein
VTPGERDARGDPVPPIKGAFMSRRLVTFLMLGALALVLPGCDSVKIRYYMNEANKAYKAQKYEDALGLYQKVLSMVPNDWAANYQVAVSYLALYHPNSTHPKDLEYAEKAVVALEKLLGMKAPDIATTEKVRGFYVGLLQSANKADKAIAFYEDLTTKEPTNPLFAAQLAQLYAKKPDFPNALKWFEKRAELEPSNKEAWYTIGVLCWERSAKGGLLVSDQERAEQLIPTSMRALEKAVSLDPDYFESLVYINLVYREKAKLAAAAGDQAGYQAAMEKSQEFTKKAGEARKRNLAAAAKAS